MPKIKYEYQEFPSWRTSPDGTQRQKFDHAEQIPEGWTRGACKLPEDAGAAGGPASFPGEAGNSAAADHTLGGDASINRGTPETHETGGGTTGGELGQTTDNTNLFSLPPVDEVDKTWVIQQLNTRKIVHNPRWRLQKLYDLLRDAVSPAHQG